MELVSSDTNIWIDFKTISRLNFPFLLPYTYIMYLETIENELLAPAGFHQELIDAGLVGVDITIEEFMMADAWGNTYPRLSVPDRIALAIAKARGILLLTGDGALRRAAKQESVKVMGTIGVLDQLYQNKYIPACEYQYSLLELKRHNHGVVRLPDSEIKSRLERLASDKRVVFPSIE